MHMVALRSIGRHCVTGNHLISQMIFKSRFLTHDVSLFQHIFIIDRTVCIKLDVPLLEPGAIIPKSEKFIYRPQYRINGEILLGLFAKTFPCPFSVQPLESYEGVVIQNAQKFHSIFK